MTMNFYFLQNLDLLSIGIVVAATAVLGFVVYFSNPKSITNRSFLAFTLVTVVWGSINYGAYQFADEGIILWLLRLVMFLAVWQAFTLFQFFYVLPLDKAVFPWWYKKFLIPIVITTSIITLTPLVFSRIVELLPPGQVSDPDRGPGLILFGLVAVGLVVTGVIRLIRTVVRSDKDVRRSLILILTGVTITFALIIAFNFLVAVIFHNRSLIPLGALFFFPFIAFTSYAILRHHLFSVRAMWAGVLVFLLAITAFFEVIFAGELGLILYRGAVFLLILFFGILLIRGILREIQQREHLEVVTNELNAANEQLRKLDEQKSDFITIASHQLRTPLSIVKGYISLIVEGSFGNLPDNLKEPLKRVNISNNRLITLVNDLLDLSRIERGKLIYVFQPSSVLEVAEDAYKEMSEAAKAKGLKLFFKKPSVTTFPKVNMDPKKIKEVMINVIDNAIHYTQHGSVTITVSDLEEKGIVRVSIKDTGIGILQEDISSLFKKFSRMENAKQISSDGTGLGLYVAKLIVEDHKGVMWVESEGLNMGSEFIFELPIIKK